MAQKQLIVFLVHPRTRQAFSRIGVYDQLISRIKLTDPVGYLDMVKLEKYSSLIVTDSGGMQKEAYFHKVPCVTLRKETEWMELVDHGFNRLVDVEAGIDQVDNWLNFPVEINQEVDLYGQGNAAEMIISIINNQL